MFNNARSVPEHPYLQPVSILFQCESLQPLLESLRAQHGALHPELEHFEQDVLQLKEWASKLTDKRDQLQSSLVTLKDAVGQIEERTAAITKDLSNKVLINCFKYRLSTKPN